MFKNKTKKKSKITPGILIVLGIFVMSIIVMVNNTSSVQNPSNSTKYLKVKK